MAAISNINGVGGGRVIAQKEGYAVLISDDEQSAELQLYGAVVSKRPVDWGTGELDGADYIVEREVLADLESVAGCRTLCIRLNSCGGECNTAIAIYNKLREMAAGGTEITCIVDGVAMSAGSYIMCAADRVTVSEGSLIMVHKAMSLVYGYLNADELRHAASINDAYDRALLSGYRRKTGRQDDELLKIMAAETYMTGTEAVAAGFADALSDSAAPLDIAAAADGSALIVGGKVLRLFGAPVPGGIPAAPAERSASALAAASRGARRSGAIDNNTTRGGNNTMAQTLDELDGKCGADAAADAAAESGVQAVSDAAASSAEDNAVRAALNAERERLRKIDAIAAQVSPELLERAKYGNPCTAEELAYSMMLESAAKGRSYLDGLDGDYAASGAAQVAAVPPADDGAVSKAAEMGAVNALIDAALGKEGKR